MNVHEESLKPFAHSANNRCFGCGPANPTGLRLEFLLASDGSVVSEAVIPGAFDGHPGNVPSGVPLRIEGHIVRGERRKYWGEATILNAEGAVLAQAKGLFIEVKP
jgi:hypothetical protein